MPRLRYNIRIDRNAVGAGFLVRKLSPLRSLSGKIAEERMLEYVVAIPLDHRPVELLCASSPKQ